MSVQIPTGVSYTTVPPGTAGSGVYRAALAFAVTLIALYQLFIDSVMKQGTGRNPCGATSPGLWPALQSHRPRGEQGAGMLLRSTSEATPMNVFSRCSGSALAPALFSSARPMWSVRCRFLLL